MNVFRSIADRLSVIGGYIAGILIFILMLLILFEIALRNLAGRSTQFTEEMGGYILVAVAFLGLAYTLRARAHVRVRLLIDRLSYKTRYVLHFPVTLLSIVVVTVGLSRAFVTTWRSYESGVISLGIVGTPQYLPQLVMVVGMAIFLIQLIALLFSSRSHWEEEERRSHN